MKISVYYISPPGWELYPCHLLDLILEKLKSTKDSLHFGTVCPEWHSTFKHNQLKVVEKSRECQVPMLLFPDEEESWIYNVMDNKVVASKLFVPYEKRFSGSSHGWLVAVSTRMSVTLYKPFSMPMEDNIDSKHTIKLPRLNCAYFDPADADNPEYTRVGFNDLVRNVLITSDPLENPDECIVFLVMRDVGIAFTRLADCSWTLIHLDFDDFRPHGFLFHNNLLYASSYAGALLYIDLETSGGGSQELVAPWIPEVPVEDVSPNRSYITVHVVESNCGNIWHVKRLSERGVKSGIVFCKTKSFRIFQLDFDTREWVPLASIGDRALFLGENFPVCVDASDFVGCKPNCIYFIHDNLGSPHDAIGIYHIENGTIESYFGNDATILSRPGNTRLPVWVTPTFNTY